MEQHYVIEVNKGSLNASRQTQPLNIAYRDGYKLFATFEQKGNTVMLFERRTDQQ